MGTATTQVRHERGADCVLVRPGLAPQQTRDRHHQSGRAVTALRRAGIDERLLYRTGTLWASQSLHRLDLPSGEPGRGLHTAHHGLPVDEHGAGAALLEAAADLDAGEPEPVAKDERQGFVRPHLEAARPCR